MGVFDNALPYIISGLDASRLKLPRVRDEIRYRELTEPPASRRISEPEAYITRQRERRLMLEALMLSEPSQDVTQKCIDTIALICAESSWSKCAMRFEDGNHPEVDLQAADTAALFGYFTLAMGAYMDEIDPRINGRMLYEMRRRVILPLLAHSDYAFMTGDDPLAPAVICSIMTGVLLLESDSARRSSAIKKLTRLLDASLSKRRHDVKLADRLTNACALSDMAELLRILSNDTLDLSDAIPEAEDLDELLFSHITGAYFMDAAGDSNTPALSGAAMFRLGVFSHDRAVSALGAELARMKKAPSNTVSGRIFDISLAKELVGFTARPPVIKHAALSDASLIVARGEQLFLGVTSGAGRGNAGDFRLFCESRPVFTGANYASVPTFSGAGQIQSAFAAADFEFGDERVIIGLDLSQAYPKTAGVRTHQRTFMLAREGCSMQLLDVFELYKQCDITFNFITETRPELFDGKAQIAPLTLIWEGKPIIACEELPGAFRLSLTYNGVSGRGMFTFFIER